MIDNAKAGCGACHQWGSDSPIKDGRCCECERNESEIIKRHGSLLWHKTNLNLIEPECIRRKISELKGFAET